MPVSVPFIEVYRKLLSFFKKDFIWVHLCVYVPLIGVLGTNPGLVAMYALNHVCSVD